MQLRHLLTILALALGSACATTTATRNVIRNERESRMAADSLIALQTMAELEELRQEVAGLQRDVASLRGDLTDLRTQSGAKITAVEEGLKWAEPVGFDADSASVSESRLAQVERTAAVFNKYYTNTKLTITGHANQSEASGEHNVRLSLDRAMAVRELLVAAGVNPNQINVVAAGATQPLAPSVQRTEPENQRVTFNVEGELPESIIAAPPKSYPLTVQARAGAEVFVVPNDELSKNNALLCKPTLQYRVGVANATGKIAAIPYPEGVYFVVGRLNSRLYTQRHSHPRANDPEEPVRLDQASEDPECGPPGGAK